MTNQQFYPILSCDGGGIRGLVTAILLEHLEKRLGKPLNKCFEMFAGTSTGSIIACGLAQGIPAEKIKELYLENGEKIFPKLDSLNNIARSIEERFEHHDPSLPLYSAEPLEEILKNPKIFPTNLLFGEIKKPTLITSYDTYNRKAVIFKSFQDRDKELSIWEVCRASSAAPIAYPGYLVNNHTFIEAYQKDPGMITSNRGLSIQTDNNKIPLIDGGIVANNPTLCAISERLRWDGDKWFYTESRGTKLDKIIVASFGTGCTLRRINSKEAESWGGLEWVSIFKGIPILDVFFDGNSGSVDYISTQLLGDNYYRFQPVFKQDIPAFRGDKDHLNALIESTNEYLESGGYEDLDKLLAVIQ